MSELIDIVQYKDSQGVYKEQFGIFLKRDLVDKSRFLRGWTFRKEELVQIACDILEWAHEKDTTPKEEGE